MQQMPHKTWVSIISDHVDLWRRSTGMSREAIAELIISEYQKTNVIGLPGIKEFSNDKTSDIDKNFEARRVNADRVFRWLDDRTKDSTLLPINFLPAVLNAFPVPIRTRCINELLVQTGMFAQNIERAAEDTDAESVLTHLKRIVKESGEVEQSLCELIDGCSDKELLNAQKEVNELLDVTKAVLRDIGIKLAENKRKKSMLTAIR